MGIYKPVCSGAVPGHDGNPVWEDVDRLSAACGGRFSTADICPQRFLAPLAPPVAARLENRSVDSSLLRSGASVWNGRCDVLLVEGAGGLLCPLADDTLVVDLVADLNCRVIIVAANRLGVINHTLLTVEVAQSRGLDVAAVVLNETSDSDKGRPDAAPCANADLLKQWLPQIPIVACDFKAAVLRALTTLPIHDVCARAIQ
jgi:dethiobiotin synthetase